MKILLVDDSSLARKVLRSFIEIHGHEVIEAVDGQNGFEKAKTHKPDLILTDALMPNVDGFTLLINIKMDPNLSSIPCVFYSAIYTGNRDRELALSLGAAAFITRPKFLEEFWEELKPVLEREKQPAAQIEKRMIDDEKEFLESYNQTVVAKLEEKVKDPNILAESRFLEMMMERSGQERMKMGFSMFDMARRQVIASIKECNPNAGMNDIKKGIFLRFYAQEFSPKEREKILNCIIK